MSRRLGYVNHGESEVGTGLRFLALLEEVCPLHWVPLPPRHSTWCALGGPAHANDGKVYNLSCYWAFRERFGLVDDWRVLRAQIIERDGGECVNCGRAEDPSDRHSKLEVDHIVEIQDGGPEFEPSNLRTLCRACHLTKTNARRQWKSSRMAESALRDRVRPLSLTLEAFT